VRGFLPDGTADFSAFTRIFTNPRTWTLLRNSVAQAVAGTVLSLLIGLPIAYLLYRTNFPGRRALQALVMVPFVLPTVVVGVAFRGLLREGGPLAGLGIDQTFTAVLLALVFFNISVVVRSVGGLWERLDPRQEQAAQMLGAHPLRVFATVTLPALTPAVAAAGSLVALYCATAFGVVLVLGGARYGTIETEIYQRTTLFLDLPGAAVLSLLQLAIVGITLAIATTARHRQERALNLTSAPAAVKNFSWRQPAHVVALIFTVLITGALILYPLGTLLARSLQDGVGNWTRANYQNLLGGPTSAFSASITSLGLTPLVSALLMSLRTALLSAAIALVIGVAISLVLSRRPTHRGLKKAQTGFDAFVMLPLGVSAVTVGFGFLITATRPLFGVDLRTSGLLIPLAQAVVAIPLVVRTLLPVLRAIDPRMQAAAQTLGASPLRVLRTIDLALLARPLGLAAGFAFAISLGEFGATSFLARPDAPTLPVLIFQLINRPGAANFGMALAAAVVLGLLIAVVMMVAELFRTSAANSL
jgi:thiamine transport system permease protein